MYLEENDLIVTDAELAALASGLGLKRGKLSILSDAPPVPASVGSSLRDFSSLEPSLRTSLQVALAVLADPAKVVQLHQTVADDTVSRSMFAQATTAPGLLVELAKKGGSRRLRTRTGDEMRFHLQNFLVAGESLGRNIVRFPLGTEAALTFLAVLDHFRYARLYSQLTHREPLKVFTPEDVKKRLQDAETEDFRWPLLFLAKLLPLPVPLLACAQDPTKALGELASAGLVTKVDDSGSLGLYELTEPGYVIGDGLWHDVGKAAVSVTAFRRDGAIVHDVVLLVRSPQDLFAFYLSGSDATVCSMKSSDLDGMLQWILGKPMIPAPYEDSAPVEEALAEKTVILSVDQENGADRHGARELPPLCLRMESGADRGKDHVLRNGGTLGRAQDNDIVITDQGVSRKHASFARGQGNTWIITDLGSSNGTRVNQVLIKEPTALAGGDEVELGDALVRVILPTDGG